MFVEVIIIIFFIIEEFIFMCNGIFIEEFEQIFDIVIQVYKVWCIMKLVDCQIIIKKVFKIFVDRQDEFVNEFIVQMGCFIVYMVKEVVIVVKWFEYLFKISDDVFQDMLGEEEKGFKRFICKVFVGLVFIIFVWNVCVYLFFVDYEIMY